MGVDLSTVFCSVEAALAIKSYSPDLMVRPCFYPEHLLETAAKELKAKSASAEAVAERIADEIDEWTGKFGALVIGPGLAKIHWWCSLSAPGWSTLLSVLLTSLRQSSSTVTVSTCCWSMRAW